MYINMIQKIRNKTYTLLRKSEGFFKTDMVYLVKGSSWLTFSQIIIAIAGLTLSVVFANTLPREVFGTYSFVISIFSILAITTLPGMATAVARSTAKGVNSVFIPAFKTRLYWGLLGSFAAIILGIYYYVNGNIALSMSFIIASVFIPILSPIQMYTAYLTGKKQFKKSGLYTMFARITSVLLIIIVLLLTQNLFLILVAYFVAHTLSHLIPFLITRSRIKKLEETTSPKQTIMYGKHLSALGAINIIAINIDKVLVFHFLGVAEVALYTFATIIPDQIRNVVKNMSTVAFPKFAEKKLSELSQGIYSKLILFVIFLTITAGLYALVAPLVYKILFPAYTDAVIYSQILSLLIIGSFATIPSTILRAQKRVRPLYLLQSSSAIIQIALLVILIPEFGLIGAVVARVATQLTAAIVSFLLLSRIIKLSNST